MKASQWISKKQAFAPGFAHVQTLCKIYAGELLIAVNSLEAESESKNGMME